MTKSNLIDFGKVLALGTTVGIIAGSAVAIFLVCLNFINTQYEAHPSLILFLPLSGLLIGLLYWHFGKETILGHSLILEEIHKPRKVLPIKMAPLVFISTLLTHIGGGSAGREGTAVQVGASLSDQLSHFFPFAAKERVALLKAGMGAGFSAALGAPFAGALFGIEVSPPLQLKAKELALSTVASVVAFAVSLYLKAPHSRYPKIAGISYSWKLFLWLFIASAAFGLLVRLFVYTTHFIEKIFSKHIRVQWLCPFLGAFPLLATVLIFPATAAFTGLGLPVIASSFETPSPISYPFLKLIFTAVTLGSGFKGGEFMPLVFMGSTLGSALAEIFGRNTNLFAALGFAAVFGGAANTPITCSILAIELFGLPIALPAALSCYISYCFAGREGIYRKQKIRHSKIHGLKVIIEKIAINLRKKIFHRV